MTTGIEASIANVLARIAETGEYRMKLTAFQARLSEQEQIKRANAYSESQFTSTLRRDFTTPYASTAVATKTAINIAGSFSRWSVSS